jgi:hypothetical protein
VGRTKVGGQDVVRPVTPADDVMQAFLWRHIVPAQELVCAVQGGNRNIPRVLLHDEEPIRVPLGGRARARFDVKGRVPVMELRFEPIAPPKGITVGEVKAMGDGFTVEVKAGREAERSGRVENLIVEAFVEREIRPKKKDGKKQGKIQKRRYSLGVLPAIPYTVVRR